MPENSSLDPSTHKCAHAMCACLIPIDREHCSEYCMKASEWEPCQCGHTLCTPEEGVGPSS